MILIDRFGNPLQGFRNQVSQIPQTVEAKAKEYLNGIDQGILAQEAQRREQIRLARVAEKQQQTQQVQQPPIQPQPQSFAQEAENMQTPQMRMPQMRMPNQQQMMMAGAVPLVYGANALVSGGNERWDRTAENTLGNLGGAAAGMYAGQTFGLPGLIAGGLIGAAAGGFASDRIADAFDPTMGMNDEALAMQAEEKKQAALSLLNQYLDPRAQAALQQRLMQHQVA